MVNAVRRAASSIAPPRARPSGRAVVRGLAAALAAAVLAGIAAAPASAHTPMGAPAGKPDGGSGTSAADSPDAAYYRSRVTAIQPNIPGLDVQVGSDGQLTLSNHTDQTVVVLGYGGEDYLRIGPAGAEENTASLTSAINSGPDPAAMPKAALGGHQQPATWVSRSKQPTYTWHDYRVLWTNKQRPPIVEAAPHSQNKVFSWAVQMRVGTQQVLVLGEVRWIGQPWLNTWQTAALVVLVLLLLVAVAATWLRRRRRNHGRRADHGGAGRHMPLERPRAQVPTMRVN